MLKPRRNVIDELWLMTGDGRWHTQGSLARDSSFNPDMVWEGLRFLVKYGFAQSCDGAVTSVRRAIGPSPRETALILNGFEVCEPERFMPNWRLEPTVRMAKV